MLMDESSPAAPRSMMAAAAAQIMLKLTSVDENLALPVRVLSETDKLASASWLSDVVLLMGVSDALAVCVGELSCGAVGALWALVVAAVLLAEDVSDVELDCTAGLEVLVGSFVSVLL